MNRRLSFETRCVSFDPSPDDPHRPSSTPIYQTATFRQESLDEPARYDYTRSGNPTRTVLEDRLADLEGGTRASAFGSGLAAIAAVVRTLESGDEVLCGEDLYGGTFRFLTRVARKSGIKVRSVRFDDVDCVAKAFSPHTRLLLAETPSNPLQHIADIRALASIAHDHHAWLAVDNTLLSPFLQNPLTLGADFVIHSATKHLCGHGDVMAGCVVTRDVRLGEEIAFLQNAEGTGLAPFESWLLLRGLKTLPLRLSHQESTTRMLVDALRNQRGVERVYWIGLDDHAGKDVHVSQARGNGSVFAFETGSLILSRKLVALTELFDTTVSFGGVHSSIGLPCLMSHASVPKEERRLPEDLVRVSVGIENAADLAEDLLGAFVKAEASK